MKAIPFILAATALRLFEETQWWMMQGGHSAELRGGGDGVPLELEISVTQLPNLG
ncbi:MAG: hypothetical protein M9935_11730 [Kiritimatiellae bacterium]|nr:hypothetical protein [Kiritimatiellia bacterium]